MSTYNLSFSSFEIASTDGPCATIEISGSKFPQPSSDQLTLNEGVLSGSFAADEHAPLVDSFTFQLADEADLTDVVVQFEGYPEDYTGVSLTISINFVLGGEEFSLVKVAAKKEDSKKRNTVVLRRSVEGPPEGGNAIISFNEIFTTFAGNSLQMEESSPMGDLTIASSQNNDLEATCSSAIDFNALTQPWLICWNNVADPENKIYLGSVAIRDNR